MTSNEERRPAVICRVARHPTQLWSNQCDKNGHHFRILFISSVCVCVCDLPVEKEEELSIKRYGESGCDLLTGQHRRQLSAQVLKVQVQTNDVQQFATERVQKDPGDQKLMDLDGECGEKNAQRCEKRSKKSQQTRAFLLPKQKPEKRR